MSRETQGKKLRVAVVYFGTARSVQLTIDSILSNVFAANPGVSFYSLASLTTVQSFTNPRNGEVAAPADPYDPVRLGSDDCLTVREDARSIAAPFAAAQTQVDVYKNDWKSIRNVLHSLSSLDRAWTFCRDIRVESFDYFLFIRPDLIYLDEIRIEQIVGGFRGPGCIAVPAWHGWNGFNDRFALADSTAAAVYARRIQLVPEYCKTRPMHPELLLLHALQSHRCKVCDLPARATRVRGNGAIQVEDFALSVAPLPPTAANFDVANGRVVFQA
jgi:hypothetical protein